MDENDPIYQAIDLGGGQTCDIAGVLRELAKAGYVIRKAAFPAGASTSEKIRSAAGDIVIGDDVVKPDEGMTKHGAIIKFLALAWADAVRDEWNAYVAADPELQAQVAVARELMRADGYTMEADPICGLPGRKAMVAFVDGKEAVCLDHSMPPAAPVTPLSAIYTNKVREVMSAAANVSKAMAEEAAKDASNGKEPTSAPSQ